MQVGQDKVKPRRNTCELYGFDFMVDDTFNVWLIEVNASPAMPHNRENTQDIVDNALESIVNILFDTEVSGGNGFKKIYQGREIKREMQNCSGAYLRCNGTALFPKPKRLPYSTYNM